MTPGNPLAQTFGLRLLYQRRIRRLGIGTVLGVVLLFRLYQFLRFTGEVQWGYDFAAYWQAGLRVLAGEPVYWAFQLSGPYPPQGIDALFLRPPVIAVLATPLSAAFSTYQAANWVWAAMCAIVLVASVLLIVRHEQLATGFDRVLFVGAAVVFAPTVGELILGNVDILLLGLLSVAWVSLGRQSRIGDLAAGGLIGVAALLKVFPALVIVWLLLTGRRRSAAASLVAMAMIVLATVPVIGIQPWLDYPRVVLNLGQPYDLRDILAPTVWLSTLLPTTISQVMVAAGAFALLWWATRSRSDAVSYALAVALSVLMAPALYPHYLSIMVLPLLLALRHAPAVGWVALAYLLMNGFEPDAMGEAASFLSRVVQTSGALLVLAILAWFGERRVGPARHELPQPSYLTATEQGGR